MNKTLYIKPFYATANGLLRAKINTIEDVRKFYAGVNELASEIASNSTLISELDSVKYGDDQKLIKAITYILGYGQVIGEYKDLFTAKELQLDPFIRKNPRFKEGVSTVKKGVMLYFNALSAAQRKEVEKMIGEVREEDKKEIEKLKKELQEVRNIKTPTATEEISIGALKYKDHSIFYNDSRLNVLPQVVSLCRLFMEESKDEDSFISDIAIKQTASAKTPLLTGNLEKLVSKLRRALSKAKAPIKIERQHKQGYRFIAQKIR